jgi:O-6-methylguanine DNA methyltransferase
MDGLSNQAESNMKLITNSCEIDINPQLEQHEVKDRRPMFHVSSAEIEGTSFAIACNDNEAMVACAFSLENQSKATEGVMNSIPQPLRSNCKPSSPDQTKFRELHDLYMGRGEVDVDSFDLSHVSAFRRKVYLLLHQIPRGYVTSYGAVAERLGSRQFARAVGTAVGSNPLSLVIPCHRVVTTSLEVLNYGMPGHKPSEGTGVKRGLLEREGVTFIEGKVSPHSLWSPT